MSDSSPQGAACEKDKDEEDIHGTDESKFPECEKFGNLYLISKMIGEFVPSKTIVSKTKSDWIPMGKVKYVDKGNGFIL